MDLSIKEKIEQRRRQILVHSYIYYELDSAYIDDSVFDNWCRELFDLQTRYPKLSKSGIYYEEFKNFDGNTGFNLPYNNPDIERKAHQLLSYQ